MSNKLSRLIAGSIPVVVYAAYIAYKYYSAMKKIQEFSKMKKNLKKEETLFEDKVMFFNGSEVKKCNDHAFGKKLCNSPDCSYGKFQHVVQLFAKSNETLDIIINLITSEEIVNSILKAYKRGVVVRIICDNEMSTNTGADMKLLTKHGVSIKTSLTLPIHAKMAIIDRKLFITGSINWTFQGIHKNFDDLLFATDTQVLKEAIEDFDSIWNSCAVVMFD